MLWTHESKCECTWRGFSADQPVLLCESCHSVLEISSCLLCSVHIDQIQYSLKCTCDWIITEQKIAVKHRQKPQINPQSEKQTVVCHYNGGSGQSLALNSRDCVQSYEPHLDWSLLSDPTWKVAFSGFISDLICLSRSLDRSSVGYYLLFS